MSFNTPSVPIPKPVKLQLSSFYQHSTLLVTLVQQRELKLALKLSPSELRKLSVNPNTGSPLNSAISFLFVLVYFDYQPYGSIVDTRSS